MSIPYRTRRALRRLCVAFLVLVLIAAVLGLCWLLWLNRYVVYTKDGAILDFDISLQYPQGEIPQKPEPGETVHIHFRDESEEDEDVSTELVRFSGFYVELSQLMEDFDGVKNQLEALPEGSTIAFDVKDLKSYFYVSTKVGLKAPEFDGTKLDQLIKDLTAKGHYLIARIPAFQEYQYILDDERTRVPYGLFKLNKKGLWLDPEYKCYWLNPTSDGAITHLIQIITELRGMGFHEVVLKDFRFPNSEKYLFDGDKQQALEAAAATLVNTCATELFAVSFTRPDADLTLPEGRTRLYITGAAAADAASLAEKTGFADPASRVVFLTDRNDTRYDAFCVLRPLDSAN